MSSALTGPASSIGSPMTLIMRPRVPAPTGTLIGAPVSVTSWPRTRPSVVSIEMVRTVDSPRCCATSSTRRLPPFLVSSAFRIAGRYPSNCTSTTAPMTWVTRPIWFDAVAIAVGSPSARRISSDRQGDRHAAAGRLRIGADLVGFFDQCLELVLVGARNRYLQVGRERKAALGIEGDLTGDLGGLAVETVFLSQQQDRLPEAGRVAKREQLLGVVAVAGAANLLRRRHREREATFVQHRAAIAAALGCRFGHIGHDASSFKAAQRNSRADQIEVTLDTVQPSFDARKPLIKSIDTASLTSDLHPQLIHLRENMGQRRLEPGHSCLEVRNIRLEIGNVRTHPLLIAPNDLQL